MLRNSDITGTRVANPPQPSYGYFELAVEGRMRESAAASTLIALHNGGRSVDWSLEAA